MTEADRVASDHGEGRMMAEKDKCKRCKKVVETDGLECEFCHYWWHTGCVGVDEELYGLMKEYEKVNKGGLFWCCGECKVDRGKVVKEVTRMTGELVKIKNVVEKNSVEVEKVVKAGGGGELKEEVARVRECLEREVREARAFRTEVKNEVEKLKGSESGVKKEVVEEIRRDMNAWKKDSAETGRATMQEIFREQSRESKREEERRVKEEEEKMRREVIEAVDVERRRNNLILWGLPEEGEEAESKMVKEIMAVLVK